MEWPTITFFAFLFMVVGGLEKVGLIHTLAETMMTMTGNHYVALMLIILWVSAILSALLDNIPFVATLIPLIQAMEGIRRGLSGGSIYRGIFRRKRNHNRCIGKRRSYRYRQSRKGYNITFIEFMKIGMPMMLMSIVLSTIYLLIIFGNYWG